MIGRRLRSCGRLFAVDGSRARLRLVDLACDDRGAIAVIFTIAVSAILLAVAVAIDFARTHSEVVRLQNARDGAALAALHGLGLRNQETAGRGDAASYFRGNTSKYRDGGALKGAVLDAEQGEVFAPAKSNMLTSLLKAVGIKAIGFASSATIRKGHGSVEVALVLDNSGSMAGQPIADLRVAAQNLTSVLYAGYEGTDKVRVGIVPFAGSVNRMSAAPSRRRAGWIAAACHRCTTKTSPSRAPAFSCSRSWACTGAVRRSASEPA
jgi:Putative Flp pilus-assembly TadE/G-like